VGRCGPGVNGQTSSSRLVKQNGEILWAPLTHLNVIKEKMIVYDMFGNLYIPAKERTEVNQQIGFSVKQTYCEPLFLQLPTR
jgi:hypothetical protein